MLKVRAYWNSQKRQWAVIKVGERKVMGYLDSLTIEDAEFRLSFHGPAQVCKSGHVNRHKWVEGTLVSFESGFTGAHPVDVRSRGISDRDVVPVWKNLHDGSLVQYASIVDLVYYGERYIACQEGC